MERQITNELLRWRDSLRRKPLLLTGVRGCGKSSALKDFGERYFSDVAIYRFDEDGAIRSIFEYDLFDTDRILYELGTVVRGREIIPGKTLVIFDGVECCPKAIASLKYFFENVRQLHLIAAGTLPLDSLRWDSGDFPVGKIDELTMYPMSFEEFVRADGGGRLLEGMGRISDGKALTALYTVPLERFLKYYYIVGGMPAAVSAWVSTHSFADAEAAQDAILEAYGEDLDRTNPRGMAAKMRQIWDSVPEQLASDNNKFVFSRARKGARLKDLAEALERLVDTGIVYSQSMVTKPSSPLSFAADGTFFKLFMADVGLLRRKAGIRSQSVLEEDAAYARFRGALAAGFLAEQLACLGISHYFWRSGNSAEIDFLAEFEGEIVPIEVRTADNPRAKNLRQYELTCLPKLAFRMSLENVSERTENGTRVVSLPLYDYFRIGEYLRSVREMTG